MAKFEKFDDTVDFMADRVNTKYIGCQIFEAAVGLLKEKNSGSE